MDKAELHQLILQASELIKRDETARAADVLKQVLRADPQQSDAWFLLAGTVDDPREQREILRRVLQLNPSHTKAQEALDWLAASQSSEAGETNRADEVKARPLSVVELVLAGVGALIGGLLVGLLLIRLSAEILPMFGPQPNPGQIVLATRVPTQTPGPRPRQSDANAVPLKLLQAQPRAMDFSRELDRLVYIAQDSNDLRILNPADGGEVVVSLSSQTRSLSVAGKYAAVGQERQVSYIDLESGTVLRTFATEADGQDVLLSPSGRIYAGTASIDVDDGSVVRSPRPFVGKMHPTGEQLYSFDDYRQILSRMDLGPDGALTGFAEFPVHWPVDEAPKAHACKDRGEFWISADGRQLFMACSLVLRLVADPRQLPTYNGNLGSLQRINGLAHLAEANQLVAVGAPQAWHRGEGWEALERDEAPLVSIYSYDPLALIASYELPRASIGQNTFDTMPWAVFPARDPRHYHIVVALNDPTAATNPIGLMTRSLDDLPARDISTAAESFQVALVDNTLTTLPFNVVDAEYSTTRDQVVLVASAPPRLILMNMASGSAYSIPLPREPLSVSVSPDGRRAAVGHDGLVSALSLDAPDSIQTTRIEAVAHDIVLAQDDRAFILGTEIHCVNLRRNSWQRCAGASISTDDIIRLSPDGISLLSTDSGASVRRFSIADGTFTQVRGTRDSLDRCRILGFFENGSQILTDCGIVLRVPADPTQYIGYGGRLTRGATNEHFRLSGLAHSSALGMLAVVDGAAWREIVWLALFHDQSLEQVNRVELFNPQHLPEYDFNPRGFVFYSADRQYIHVILALQPLDPGYDAITLAARVRVP